MQGNFQKQSIKKIETEESKETLKKGIQAEPGL